MTHDPSLPVRVERQVCIMALNDLIIGVETAGEQVILAMRADAPRADIRRDLVALRALADRLSSACTGHIAQIDGRTPAMASERGSKS